MTGFLGAEWGVGRGSEDVSEVAAALAVGGGSHGGVQDAPREEDNRRRAMIPNAC